jgi:hypothetical protein
MGESPFKRGIDLKFHVQEDRRHRGIVACEWLQEARARRPGLLDLSRNCERSPTPSRASAARPAQIHFN